ncbi:MAG: hypothetical protein ACLTW7_15790 [Enterococcus sp.]
MVFGDHNNDIEMIKNGIE